MLFKAGITDRLGKSAEGNTVCDYDSEEIKRKISINTTLASFEYEGFEVNLIDTPGMFDFIGGMYEGISACSTAMITVSAKSGVKAGTLKAYSYARKNNKSTIFVVSKIDDQNANFYNTLTELKTVFGPSVCPVVVPVIKNGAIDSYINLIEMKAYRYQDGNAVETDMPAGDISDKMDYRLDGLVEAVSEAVAEADEELMEKFFDGGQFTQKEIINGIHKGMNNGTITPVVCASSLTLDGIDMLLKEITLLMPSPEEKQIPEAESDGSETEIPYDCNAPVFFGSALTNFGVETFLQHFLKMTYAPTARQSDIGMIDPFSEDFSAFVFKTVADPFVGKMSFIEVHSGSLKANSDVINASTGETEKIGKLYRLCGKKQTEITEAFAGEIVAAVKISANTCDTLCSPSRIVKFAPTKFPVPCYRMAVKAKSQTDESKISSGIHKLLEEDKTLSYTKDSLTNERIISGLGEQHIDVAVSKLKNKFGVEVEVSIPKTAYKETIRKKVKAEGKHKKQSGGHGQYGHVVIEFEPTIGDELVFEEKVFGGAVPKNYFPAVEKGLQECMTKGVLAGCPVSGLKATLLDGSYHPVDSSEMAFKMAASIAYKEGLKNADPVLLEPIGSLSVTVPDDNTGDVMGELNKRRGRMLGMNPAGDNMTEIIAEVPMREMHDFTMYLRQVTKGMGSFTFDFVRYEQLPAALVSDVILSINSDN